MVEKMLGVKKRTIMGFLAAYRKIRRKLAEWESEKATRESSGDGNVHDWEDIIRPAEDAKHRPGQRTFGEERKAFQVGAGVPAASEKEGGQEGSGKKQGKAADDGKVEPSKLTDCDASCRLPARWGERLVDLLRGLSPMVG